MKLLLEIKGIFGGGVGYKKVKHEIDVTPIYKTENIEIDSMKIPNELKVVLKEINSSKYLKTSLKEQYDEYLTKFSSTIIRDIMKDLNIEIIEDWKILRVGEARNKKSNNKIAISKEDKNKIKVGAYISLLRNSGDISNEFSIEFEAFYVHMYNSIKHLKSETQIKIVLSSINVSIKSLTKAFRSLNQYTDDLKKMSLKELQDIRENNKNNLLNN
jgi:hypothetical protein